jgi:POT family proton-dependent oligopeptide transporter
MPSGIPFIIGNEAAERFSFYGMKTILVVFMTQYVMGDHGRLDVMPESQATEYFHDFTSAAYIFPLAGAFLSDGLLGKYRTILLLSTVYCLGHLALALDDTRFGLMVGLSLIAIGAGGIKPCVSAHVGDQFGLGNQHLLDRVFGWFYFAINFGSTFSTLLTPWLLQHHGPAWAFGLPGVLMAIATVTFWAGRNRFVHIPPAGKSFIREAFGPDGLRSMAGLMVIYVFVAMFWALFDQTGSTWVLQAKRLDLTFAGTTWLPSQVQAINPILVMLFIPVFGYAIYPAINRVFPLTPLRKISIGFFIAVPAFLIPAYIESRLADGHSMNIAWQLFAYVILTAAEVLISITCLEFSYTQAPNRMKSLVMGLFFSSVAMGNWFTARVNSFIRNVDGTSKLQGADYYLFFATAMLATAVVFIVFAMRFKEKRYLQEESA